jgi:hypothetical protein
LLRRQESECVALDSRSFDEPQEHHREERREGRDELGDRGTDLHDGVRVGCVGRLQHSGDRIDQRRQ